MSGGTSAAMRAWGLRAIVSALALGVIALGAIGLQRASVAAHGPRELAWGETPCAHCRMLVSDPRYAAQLVTRDGELQAFDDPGCLLQYLAQARPDASEIYYHHSSEQRWLKAPAVSFAPAAVTPMGFGLAAVDPGTGGTLSLLAAAQHARAFAQKGGH